MRGYQVAEDAKVSALRVLVCEMVGIKHHDEVNVESSG